MKKNIIKGKGKYWYKLGNNKTQYNKCICGNFKTKIAKKCFKCANLRKDGTFRKKPRQCKKFKMSGYNYVYFPEHHRSNKNGYVGKHILVAEEKIGRKLRKNEIAHHINEQRDDNRIENIMVMTKKQHNKHHNPKTKHLSGKYYGKHLSHMKDKCVCGNMKDIRAKNCNGCIVLKKEKLKKWNNLLLITKNKSKLKMIKQMIKRYRIILENEGNNGE